MIALIETKSLLLKDFFTLYSLDCLMYNEWLQEARHSINHVKDVYSSFLKDQNESGFFRPQLIKIVKCVGEHIQIENRFETNGGRFFVLDGGHTIKALWEGWNNGKFKGETSIIMDIYVSDNSPEIASKFSQINQAHKSFKRSTKIDVKIKLKHPNYEKIKEIHSKLSLPYDIVFAACTGETGPSLIRMQNNFNIDARLQNEEHYENCLKALSELHKPFVRNNTHNTIFNSWAENFIKIFYKQNEDGEFANVNRLSMSKVNSFLSSEKNFKKLLQKMDFRKKLIFIQKEFFTVSRKNKPFNENEEEN